MKKNIAVYTCITDSCNQLTSIKHLEKNIDYYCFTNNKNFKSDEWNIVYIDDESLNDEMLFKKYKILGFPEIEEKYDTVIYIDNNIQIEESINEIINKYCDFSKNVIFFLNHPELDCAYKASKEYILSNIEHPSIIKNQFKFYMQEKFPEKYGFVSTDLIIRKTKNKKLWTMQKKWYEQVLNFSKNDELSVMYSLWKHSIAYEKIDLYNTPTITVKNNMQHKVMPFNCVFGSGITNTLGLIEEENKYEPEKENYICKIEDLNDSHSSIARKVKKGSTVLDIGCGVGIIGKLLFENKNCINYGIEIDKESYKKAIQSGCYKEVYNISIESEKQLRQILDKEIKFDYIILADVLEHIKEPCEVISNLIPLLNNEGKILISIPNIAYIDIIRALIDRQFNYQKTGILDSTHFRFFTKKSFAEMIDNFNSLNKVNFDVNYFDSTRVDPKYNNNLLNEILDVDKEATIVQNIFELTKISPSQVPTNLIKLLKENEKSNYSIIEKQLEQYKIEKEELDLQNKELNERIDKIESERINKLRLKNRTLNRKIKQLELEKNSLNQRIEEIDLNNNLLNQKVEELNLDNDQLNCEIKKILESKSWKITAPLRKIIKILKINK